MGRDVDSLVPLLIRFEVASLSGELEPVFAFAWDGMGKVKVKAVAVDGLENVAGASKPP